MSKFYVDFEFLNDVSTSKGKTLLQPISIGIADEYRSEGYYGIFNDFDLKRAWNQCTVTEEPNMSYHPSFLGWADGEMNPMYIKTENYWLRDNVLKPIHYDLSKISGVHDLGYQEWVDDTTERDGGMYADRHYKTLKKLLKEYGKSSEQIKREVMDFINSRPYNHLVSDTTYYQSKPEFYGYYCGFDYVLFSQLFGNMNEYPEDYPMYFIDIKVILEGLKHKIKDVDKLLADLTIGVQHNALSDAKFNRRLYELLDTIK